MTVYQQQRNTLMINLDFKKTNEATVFRHSITLENSNYNYCNLKKKKVLLLGQSY